MKDISRKIFGKLWALKPTKERASNGSVIWLCKCECGKGVYVSQTKLQTGNTQSCGCIRGLPEGEASFNELFHQYRKSARTRGHLFKLSKNDFRGLTKQNCKYCGAEPSSIYQHDKFRKGSYIYSGIDRVDNTKGYTKDNCAACCKICNMAKSKRTVDEFLDWIEKVYNYTLENDV